MDGTTQLAVAELAIYLILIFLGFFILFKHGKHGLEPWLFYVIFCSLRIVAGGLQISNWNKIKDGNPSSDTASIVNSVGISALLLCTCGVLHEANTFFPGHNRKMAWTVVVANHILVATGIGLAAVGGSKLSQAATADDRKSDKTLLIAGYFVIFAAMIGQLAYGFLSLRTLRHSSSAVLKGAKNNALILIYATILAVIILFARVIYGIVYGFTLKLSLSPYEGSLAVKVVLFFLVQLLAAMVLGLAGLKTRGLGKTQPTVRYETGGTQLEYEVVVRNG